MPEDKIQRVYLSMRTSLTHLVSRIVPPRDVEDIVQETYVRLCQVKDTGRVNSPRSFIMKTARNLALDHIKRAESRLTDSMGDEDNFWQDSTEADRAFEEVYSQEEFAHFCEAVRMLPLKSRRVFVLKKVYGHTQKEIASLLNLKESTVEKHIAVGIKRCALHMMGLDPDQDHSKRNLTSTHQVQKR